MLHQQCLWCMTKAVLHLAMLVSRMLRSSSSKGTEICLNAVQDVHDAAGVTLDLCQLIVKQEQVVWPMLGKGEGQIKQVNVG